MDGGRSDAAAAMIVLVVLGIGLAASYGLALLGEPSSAWLWSLVGAL